jgi:hypothetical protein
VKLDIELKLFPSKVLKVQPDFLEYVSKKQEERNKDRTVSLKRSRNFFKLWILSLSILEKMRKSVWKKAHVKQPGDMNGNQVLFKEAGWGVMVHPVIPATPEA